MCLLIVLSRVLADWPLVVAANRDEAYARPAEPLGVLRDQPHRTLGSRDLLAGGTALAVNDRGVVAGLTNQPASRDPSKRSRGEIPLGLTEEAAAIDAVAAFRSASPPGAFNPCWVLVADRSSLVYLDLTRPEHVQTVELGPGLHVLENQPLDEASAKVDHVRAVVGDPRARDPGELQALLEGLLADHTRPRSATTSPIAGCCVHTEHYGTRSSMLVRVPREGRQVPEVWASDGPSCVNPLRAAFFSSA